MENGIKAVKENQEAMDKLKLLPLTYSVKKIKNTVGKKLIQYRFRPKRNTCPH